MSFSIPTDDALDFLAALIAIDSPTGRTDEAIAYCEERFGALALPGLTTHHTRKGGLIVHVPAAKDDAPHVGLTAHVDTLGLMVKEIKSSGRLKCTRLGGIVWNGVEFEGVTVYPADGEPVRGSAVPVNGSVHVNRNLHNMDRNEDTIEIRLDARTSSADETRELGIRVGDFVCLDTRYEVNNGFIRSRFLDDKLSVACIYGALAGLATTGTRPACTTTILISNYEEVGHGAAADLPADLHELLAVDMAAVGDGQASDEFHCTLCVKDSGGPYHYGTNQRLRRIAAAHDVDLISDIYPYYNSDGTAYWRAGGPARVGLVGPGVDSSHGYERSHTEALTASAALLAAYLQDTVFD